MNFDKMTKEIFTISKGRINGETKNLHQFRKELRPFLDDAGFLPVQVGLEIRVKKKYYYCVATKTAVGYDYYIPTDREDEERLKKDTGYYND